MSSVAGKYPGELWSLLDMLEFYAHIYVEVSSFASSTGQILASVEQAYPGKGFNLQERAFEDWLRKLEPLPASAATHDLPLIKAAAENVIVLVKEIQTEGTRRPGKINNRPEIHIPEPLMRALRDRLTVLNSNIKGELAAKVFLDVPTRMIDQYRQTEPLFGPLVDKKFPSLLKEIEESGKCLALGRSTASAFHSVRCLEAGLRAVSRCLGIPDPTTGAQRNWHFVLDGIEKELTKRWPKSIDRFSGDGKIFSELHGFLSAMKNPYRNDTMHLDRNYDEGDARDIMGAIRSVMKMIASRMNESGEPKA
jgi:hypothetical protein